MEHSTYVQEVSGGKRFFASCMVCGCDQFPDRETRAEAEADAQAHGRLVTFPRIESVRLGNGVGATAWAGPPPLVPRDWR